MVGAQDVLRIGHECGSRFWLDNTMSAKTFIACVDGHKNQWMIAKTEMDDTKINVFFFHEN